MTRARESSKGNTGFEPVSAAVVADPLPLGHLDGLVSKANITTYDGIVAPKVSNALTIYSALPSDPCVKHRSESR